MTQNIFIKLKGISKSFAGVRALQNIDMEIKQGEVRCLAGENGGGKSTLIKIISGFYQPDDGTIEIDGTEYTSLTPQQAIDLGIQVIYQDFSVFPNLTVAENIALMAERQEGKRIVNWKNVRERAKEALDTIGVDLDLDMLVGDLPVAGKQLVAICRSLLLKVRLLIMDEPTTALTRTEVESLFRVVRDLKAKGISVVFVSHKLEEVYEIAEQLTILRNGKKVIEGPIKEFDREKFVFHMTGRAIENSPFEPTEIGTEPLLEAKNIGIKDLFRDISFSLYPGEILGITGLLGSGCNELAKALFSMEKITEGEILLEGKPHHPANVGEAIRSGIAYVPEDRLTEGLFMPQAISVNMVSAVMKNYLTRFGFIDQKRVVDGSENWISELKVVTPSAELPVQALSGGNQQKVVLAKWLEISPKVLILNCPTVGIDVGAKADIYQLTRTLAAQGIGVIFISDNLPEVLENCNRLIVMKRGRMVGEMDAKIADEEKIEALLSADREEEVIR